jgi:hypothetical protein
LQPADCCAFKFQVIQRFKGKAFFVTKKMLVKEAFCAPAFVSSGAVANLRARWSMRSQICAESGVYRKLDRRFSRSSSHLHIAAVKFS